MYQALNCNRRLKGCEDLPNKPSVLHVFVMVQKVLAKGGGENGNSSDRKGGEEDISEC